jgi:hypothetical protein
MLSRKRPSVVSFRVVVLAGAAGAAIALAIGTPDARAFPTYSGWYGGECRTCHGDFTASIYQPPSGDQEWTDLFGAGALHGNHWTKLFVLGSFCEVCHLGPPGQAVVRMSESGDPDYPLSCIGCHGRAEHDAGGVETGAGLRRHHWNGGVPCTPCHADSEPAFGFTPVGEQVFPPNYLALGMVPSIAALENFAGSPLGLDNDGDYLYDEADPDSLRRCGLGIELALLLPPLVWLRRFRRRGAA